MNREGFATGGEAHVGLSVRAIAVAACVVCAAAVLIGCSPAPSGDTMGAPDVTGASSPVPSTTSSAPAAMPGDFTFVLSYGVMAKNILDTGKGTFTHDMISDASITTDLALTPEEMSEVYERLREIDFWAYPAALPNEVGVMPSTRYLLDVRGEGLVHSVGGDDIQYAASLRAVALWKFIERVQEMIMSKDAYRALPEPRGGYL